MKIKILIASIVASTNASSMVGIYAEPHEREIGCGSTPMAALHDAFSA